MLNKALLLGHNQLLEIGLLTLVLEIK